MAVPGRSAPVARLQQLLETKRSRLDRYLTGIDQLVVEIARPDAVSDAEHARLMRAIRRNNFAIYQFAGERESQERGYKMLCARLGLKTAISNPAADAECATSIRVVDAADVTASRYIPFTSRALKWHTDGYYNDAESKVRAFVLHCKQKAISGGGNEILDHEIAMLLLREENPDWIDALARPDAFHIPPNRVNGKVLRAGFSGPVCSVDTSGGLYMRFTERSRNIEWTPDPDVQEARAALMRILRRDDQWKLSFTLQPGQGLICNNILHRRDSFVDGSEDGQQRLLRRIRYRERVGGEDNA